MTYQNQEVPPAPQSNGMAVASMVLGILSILTAWIPIVGMIAWILAPVGLILGFIAVRRLTGKGMAIAGIVTSAIGLIICIVWVVGLGAMMNTPEGRAAMEQAQRDAAARQQTQ